MLSPAQNRAVPVHGLREKRTFDVAAIGHRWNRAGRQRRRGFRFATPPGYAVTWCQCRANTVIPLLATNTKSSSGVQTLGPSITTRQLQWFFTFEVAISLDPSVGWHYLRGWRRARPLGDLKAPSIPVAFYTGGGILVMSNKREMSRGRRPSPVKGTAPNGNR